MIVAQVEQDFDYFLFFGRGRHTILNTFSNMHECANLEILMRMFEVFFLHQEYIYSLS